MIVPTATIGIEGFFAGSFISALSIPEIEQHKIWSASKRSVP
jgi:hypothetical protein